jgi:hypothetical protein
MSLAEEIGALKSSIKAAEADVEMGMAMAMANVDEGELPPVEVTAGAAAKMLRVELNAVWKAIDLIAARVEPGR